ncbi:MULTISPECIES: hypothetical protein [unclassified Mycobacterium]|uniref:hypothetical protein n=1 Tax=unclassified Mycobacterium TaxID=2642494 RepID=UPI0007FE663D|nr:MULTISPECIES: hypothetical protein [unclassified Mycobacterium]OBG63560.1 hypothetical protein A5704_15405 [Mycobacterium sp. E735]
MSVASEGRAPVTIDADVELLAAQIQALEALGRKDLVEDGEVYDFSVRWGAVLAGRLPRLVHYSSLGLLDDADRHRFESLCADLSRVSESAERLGLPRPVLSDDRAATTKTHRRLRMRSRSPMRRS